MFAISKMSNQRNKKRVLVAMSGGVDSSVAALLLKQKGYEVIGVTMCFGLEDSKNKRPSCCGISGIEDAKRVAEQIGISHYVFSFGKLLKEKVIDEFVREYLSGRTPNPCIRCNQYLKFDALIKKAKELNCDYLATGHYARIVRSATKIGGSAKNFAKKSGQFFLKRARDTKKDQSYFLFRIPKDRLNLILFPLGGFTKEEVRKIARENSLRVADKPGSQEVCFITDGNYKNFIRDRIHKNDLRAGPIKDIKGNVLGQHSGIAYYTVGQRQGIGIAYKHALYVVKIDKNKNTIVVGNKEDVYRNKLKAGELHLLALKTLPKRLEVKAKIRYNHPKAKAVIRPLGRNKIVVEFKKPQWAVTPGQSVVFYKNNIVIGGATIK
jgi:tRNA-specific 2-thiouridylase